MHTIDELREQLKEALPHKRFKHSVAVYATALKMAEHYKLPPEKIAVAALLHDCGREVPTPQLLAKARELGLEVDYVEERQQILLHAKLGAYFAEHKYGVTDPEILRAIRLHSTGAPDMTELDMVIYLADLIEPGRDFDGVEDLRKAVYKDLELGMLRTYAHTMRYLLDENLLIHPDCVNGYNQLAAKFNARGAQE